MSPDNLWLEATQQTLAGYRKLIDAALVQLDDDQLFRRPQDGVNSVAHILRHLGGNLQSRWTNFLTEDGEKASRDRDQEFADWDGSREELTEYFEAGWNCLTRAIDSLVAEDLAKEITIRGEAHTLPQAIQRSTTHVSYHVGQILLISRMVHGDPDSWHWLSIRPGGSRQHNESTWGSSGSRGTMGEE